MSKRHFLAGFAINGEVLETSVMTKSQAQEGHSIVLTKALGTGVLLAAHMQGKAKGRWISGTAMMRR